MTCLVSEGAADYIPVILGVVGITASVYNYVIHTEILQSERDMQLLASLGTTALIGFVATTILKSARLSTCNIPIEA